MSWLRGKSVMTRAQLTAELLDFNTQSDGPWEPAVFVDREAVITAKRFPSVEAWLAVRASARVAHDHNATHDIHLPGDGAPFDAAAVVSKLLIAEVIEDI